MNFRPASNKFNVLSLAFGLSWLMIGFADFAHAHANCGIYARYTALQFRNNIADKCSYTGRLWEGSIKEQMEWCNDVGFAQVRRVLAERQKLLEQCRKSQTRN